MSLFKRYNLIFEYLPFPAAVVDKQGIIVIANKAMEQLLNLDCTRIQHQELLQFIPGSSRLSFKRQWESVEKPPYLVQGQVKMGTKSMIREVTFYGSRILNHKGQEAFLWVGQDNDIHNHDLRHKEMIDNLPSAAIEMDTQGNIYYANYRFAKMLMMGRNQIEGKKNIADFVPEYEKDNLAKNISTLAQGKLVGRNEYTAVRKDNRTIPVLSDSIPIRDPKGNVVGIRTVIVDITQRKEFEDQLRENEEKFRTLFNNANDPIFLFEFDPQQKKFSNFLEVNKIAIEKYGYSKKRFLNMSPLDLLDKESMSRVPSVHDKIAAKGRHTFEMMHVLKNGKKISVEVSCRSYRLKDKTIAMSIARDITERKKVENKVRYFSFHDKLTGLYNRSYFEEELKRLDTRRQLPLSIIMGDLDGLKLINDAFGHMEGDKLLVKASSILMECFREEDIVARWGGDEFAILLPKTSSFTAHELIKRIKKRFQQETVHYLPLSISLGLSTKNKAYQKVEEKVVESESQMYKSKLNESKKLSLQVIDSLRKTLNEKLEIEDNQGKEMKALARKLGSLAGLKGQKLDNLEILCHFYDIGLISVPVELLHTKRKLSKKELKIIRQHAEVGYRICITSSHLSAIAFDVLSHHEWWNGNGYPQRLKGEQIPLNSRIIALVDAYKAMTNHKPYRKPLNKAKIIEELKAGAGRQFDPILARQFIAMISSA